MSATPADSLVDQFAATLDWPLDPFQREAMEKLDRGRGVLVSAPTSAGKTLVAEYAIHRALASGRRCFYTTPLKALSNQKYQDLLRVHGADACGLVTGENSINDAAPIVVMTTEILRNLIYEEPERLARVDYVVLDEIHYIDEFPRGSVWEEVIIQAPPHMKFIGLSATIANYDEVADWMSRHRGQIETVSITERPVELKMWLALKNRLHPLFVGDGTIDHRTWQLAQREIEAVHSVEHFRRMPSNDLIRVIEELESRQMLPAIYFIFSRRGCREALQRCGQHGLDLTTEAEKEAIVALVESRLAAVSDRDERELYRRFLNEDALRRGLAAHHAGLLPYLKEMVEHLFQRGLIKVVFATETLSLGINMPARAVVVSTFTKFDGINFSNLTTGELIQLMGRAGRRGIDTVGHGIILKEGDVDIGTIYEVAMGEGLVVESKFLPTYNMTLNLLRHHSPEAAAQLMEGSFGQFQKYRAAELTRERAANLQSRLDDLQNTEFHHPTEPCDESTIATYVTADQERHELKLYLRRLRRDHWRHHGSGGRRGRHPGSADQRIKNYPETQARLNALQRSWNRLPCHQCPNLADHLAQHLARRDVELELARARREVDELVGEYARRLRHLLGVLSETGYVADDQPTPKGLLASRIYGENNLLVVEAVDSGWLDPLSPAELAAALVMLCAEDRGRDRGPRAPRKMPTNLLAETQRRLRSLYFRFSALEKRHGQDNFRPISLDFVEFTYRWCQGAPLPSLPLPAGVDFGDALKAVKSLYSTLRQLEWAVPAEDPLRARVREALAAVERDVIRKI